MGLVHVGAQRESFWGTWKTDHTNLRAPLSIASIRPYGWPGGVTDPYPFPGFVPRKKRGVCSNSRVRGACMLLTNY
jgi:hypothetical protein